MLLLGTALGTWIACFRTSAGRDASAARLEEILVIKELHLVRHHYTDIFLFHRQNDKSKSVRAIAKVPATITAFLDLRQAKWIKRNDSIKEVQLPHAQLDEPNYKLDQMIVEQTRSLQIHIGNDLYPRISQYLSRIVAERADTIRQLAINNNILLQAETEGKQYLEELLEGIGRKDVNVTFGDFGSAKTVIVKDNSDFRMDQAYINVVSSWASIE